MAEKSIKQDSTWKEAKVPRGKHHNETATKTTVSLYLTKKVVQRARFHNLNLSRIAEQALLSILDYLESQNSEKSSISSDSRGRWWAGPDLNQRPLACKANVLPN